MADYKLLTMLMIMASMNIVLFLFQGGITEANPDGAPFIFNQSTSPAATYISSDGENYVMTADKEDFDIESSDSVDEESGNLFTDSFKTMKQWFNKQETRFGTVSSILKQPYGFMEQVGIPSPISAGFAFIWYSVAVILLIGFIRGGNQ